MDNHLLKKVRQLDVQEQIELVEAIWDGIVEGKQELPLTSEQIQELDSRLAEYLSNPKDTLSWDEVKAELMPKDPQ